MDWFMPLAVATVMIVLDLVSGVAKAVATKTLSSSKMREGMWHKCGYVFVICCACTLEWAAGFLDLGFEVPAVVAVCALIVGAELLSVLENAAELNPDLKGSKLLSLFDIDVRKRGEE